MATTGYNWSKSLRPSLKFILLLLNTGGQPSIIGLNLLNNTPFPLCPRYYKILDPGSWISVDRNTGELRVANTIDRESHFVKDGMYYVTMKAVDTSKLLLNAT